MRPAILAGPRACAASLRFKLKTNPPLRNDARTGGLPSLVPLFNSEHLNLEFKVEFPHKNNKFDIPEICRYVAKFSNEEGGLVVYGIADGINNPEVLPKIRTGT